MPTLTLTQRNFDTVITSNPIVLIDWWAAWCGPCRHFAPIFESSSERHPDIVHAKVDTEAEQELSAAAQITGLPTLMAFREGLLVYSEAGVPAAETLEELIQQIKWLDMEQFRRELSNQAEAQQTPAYAPSAPEPAPRQAGHAATSDQYGWPGI
ncbi:thioredoxin [Nocardia iowensis]|uniref:Thiol reductase thioredoxin n=1 Tax=Nocardia iowensis TaxID=204891 RepID=A0ABX8RZB3_NOCIO|nr:thiol reductase thioredoxin [Nocardia iowensis]